MLRRYWTWRATSWSERGGRKEKVSKNLEKEGFGGQSWIFFVFLSGLFGGRVWIKREFAGLASPARGPRAHERARDLAKIIR